MPNNTAVYFTVIGDTWETVSRKSYGTPDRASQLQLANPHISNLQPEMFVKLPRSLDIGAPVGTEIYTRKPNRGPVKIPTVESLQIIVAGYDFPIVWSEFELIEGMDSFSSFNAMIPLVDDYLKVFTPFSFKQIVVKLDGQTLFNGTVSEMSSSYADRTMFISAYATCAVLESVTPAERRDGDSWTFTDQKLTEVFTAMCQPFGIDVHSDSDETLGNDVFTDLAPNPDEFIMTFFKRVAKGHGVVFTNDEYGDVVVHDVVKSENNTTQGFVLREGESPVLEIDASFDHDRYYSTITGVRQDSVGLGGERYTIRPAITNAPERASVFRPYSATLEESAGQDIEQATQSMVGRMFANALTYKVTVASWFRSDNTLFRAGGFVNLKAPSVWVPEFFRFQIRSITYSVGSNGTYDATLELIIPGTLSGRIPERLPWDG